MDERTFKHRTKCFALEIMRLIESLPRSKVGDVIGRQLLRSGTSVAAHARESSRARSDNEFCSKLDGLLQEADESHLRIELLRDDCGIQGDPIEHLHRETGELIAIFTTIVSKLRKL